MERTNGERGNEYTAGWTRFSPGETFAHSSTNTHMHIHTYTLTEQTRLKSYKCAHIHTHRNYIGTHEHTDTQVQRLNTKLQIMCRVDV